MATIKQVRKFMNYLIEEKIVLNQQSFGESLGYKNKSSFSQLLNKEEVSEVFINKIKKVYPEFSDWLFTEIKDNTAGRDIITGNGNVTGDFKGNATVNIDNSAFNKELSEAQEMNVALMGEKVDYLQGKEKGELKPKTYPHRLEVRLVSNKAKAGWSDGYYNDEYLENMPVITIDADESYKGRYMAFEVSGDSMEPDYLEGDVVICREIQRHLWNSKLHFKDWDFVIAHSKQGIMLKEIIAHNVDTGDITCRSINSQHKDFALNLKDIAYLFNVVEVRQKGKRKRWNRAKDFFND